MLIQLEMVTQTRPVRSDWMLNILKIDMKDMLMDWFGYEERRGFKNDSTIYLRIIFFDVKLWESDTYNSLVCGMRFVLGRQSFVHVVFQPLSAKTIRMGLKPGTLPLPRESPHSPCSFVLLKYYMAPSQPYCCICPFGGGNGILLLQHQRAENRPTALYGCWEGPALSPPPGGTDPHYSCSSCSIYSVCE